MLGLPPAFVLSQDQTLQFDLLCKRGQFRVLIELLCDAYASRESVSQTLFFIGSHFCCNIIYVAYVSLSFSVFIVAANLYQTQSARAAYTRDEFMRQEVFLVFVNNFVARLSLARKSRPQARLREQHQSLKSAEQPPTNN